MAYNYLNTIFNPFGYIDIAGFYLSYFPFIDAIVYLILFLSLTQIVFLKVYAANTTISAPGNNRKEAKMVALAVSLALTISMVVLESQTGFYIGKLAPIALIVFLAVLAMFLYNLLLGLFPVSAEEKTSKVSAALTYLIIYGLMIVPFGVLYRWIQVNVPLLSAILELATVVAFVYLLIELFKVLGLGGDKKDGGGFNAANIMDALKPKKTSKDDNNKGEDLPKKDPTKDDKPDKELKTILDLLEEIRKDIAKGVEGSRKSVENTLKEVIENIQSQIEKNNKKGKPENNKALHLQLEELQPVLRAKDIDELDNIVDEIVRSGKSPIVRGYCGGIQNKIKEFKYYEALHKIFSQSTNLEKEYHKILQSYTDDKTIKNKFDSMNKPERTNAQKTVDKIALAIRLLNKRLDKNS